MIAALYALVALFAILGLPLFLVIFGVTLVGGGNLDPANHFVEIFRKIVDNPIFITIPLFAHAGFVLSESRAPERLVELTRSALGFIPGGAAHVAIVACALFTAFTGASGVTIIALGGLLFPVLVQERYPERFGLGLITTGGSLGLLFPPSLPIIVYVLIASNIAPLSVDTLFLAGIVPGLFLVLVLALYGAFVGRRHASRGRQPFEARRVGRAFAAAIFELPIPLLIIGGIFGGYVTLAQAAAVVAIYVSFIEVFVYQDLSLAELARATTRSMVLVGGILVVIMAALAMTNLLTDKEIPDRILKAMGQYITHPLVFLLLLNVFLLIVGCLMDIYSAILVVVPLVLPIALKFGIDPVHLGIIFLTNLEIGYSTPPVGINLFISSLRFGKPVVSLYRASLPFIALLIVCLAVITYVPWLTMSLVRIVEQTGSVEVAWAQRTSDGEGTLTWAQRSDPESDPDVFEAPGPSADSRTANDLSLRYGPVRPDELDRLQSGEEPVETRFTLSRASSDLWSLKATWKTSVRNLEDLAGTEHPVESISVIPADSPLARIPLVPENWSSASSVRIDSVEGERVRGALRGMLLWFPPDENLPAEIYDLEVSFDVPAEIQAEEVRDLPEDAPTRTVHDVRLVRREAEDGRSIYLLERTRPRPYNLGTVFTADSAEASGLKGLEARLDTLRLALEDVEGFPDTAKEARQVRFARIVVEDVDGDVVTGRVEAVISHEKTGAVFDVVIRFRLPVREAEE